VWRDARRQAEQDQRLIEKRAASASAGVLFPVPEVSEKSAPASKEDGGSGTSSAATAPHGHTIHVNLMDGRN
jgi:hypothetical protein